MTSSLTKGDHSRAEILDAARQLFIANGFHGTSMRAIARAAGDRAVAGLYNHFPTKGAIFEALIEERNPYDDLFGALEPALAGAQTAPEFIRAALKTILRVMPQHYDFLQLAQIDAREFEGRNMRGLLNRQALPRLMLIVGRLESMPGLKPVEPFVWLRLIASLIIGFITTGRAMPIEAFRQLSDEAWGDRFADILLYGLVEEMRHD